MLRSPRNAAPISTIPMHSGTRGPNRAVSTPPSGDEIENVAVSGSNRTPAWTGE